MISESSGGTTEKLCYLSLGSNLGDRLGYLRQAVHGLNHAGHRVSACSAVYRTEPLEISNQPEFLNLALEVGTTRSARQLLEDMQSIETQFGRQRDLRFGPRTIDLDLLFFADEIIQSEDLTVPHPRLHLRKFVLVPLSEIAPLVRHPVLLLTVAQLLQRTSDNSSVERYCGPLT